MTLWTAQLKTSPITARLLISAGLDGLLHVTDISWKRISHPSEVLKLGQHIKVQVIKFDDETKRISLGMKQLEENPWSGVAEKFPVGKIVEGKVSNIADYGVFIDLVMALKVWCTFLNFHGLRKTRIQTSW